MRTGSAVLRGGAAWSVALAAVCGASPVAAQSVRPVDGGVPGRPVAAPGAASPVGPAGSASGGFVPNGADGQDRPATGAAAALAAGNRLVVPTAPRNFGVDGSVEVRATATDRGRLDQSSGSDTVLGVSPRLSLFSRGAQLRVNATVGVDHVQYLQNTNGDYTQPLVGATAQAELVENLLYFDGAVSYDRRAATPYAAQSGADVPADEQVKTGIVRLVPRLEHRGTSGWNTLVRSDNVWTKRSGNAAGLAGQSDDSYSQNTRFSVDKVPQRFGGGLEGSHESLRYEDQSEDVLRLDSARASAGMAVTPQFTGWLLGGVERSRFSGRTENDADYGVRARWAPLDRSVLTAEVRQRFFGTGYNVQWDHRHRNYTFSLGGSREPFTEPDSVQLSGNVADQFDAIYRARGYDTAQRDALVRAALIAYGLPANLTDPVSLRVNRPQLATAYNGMVSFLGRRTVVVVSSYYRKLTELRRSDDPVVASLARDLRQVGGQLSYNLLLSPLSSFDASYRIDDTRGLGLDIGRNSRDQLVSVGTSHSLSPKLRVNLAVQHHRLETETAGSSTSASANSATLGLLYRF